MNCPSNNCPNNPTGVCVLHQLNIERQAREDLEKSLSGLPTLTRTVYTVVGSSVLIASVVLGGYTYTNSVDIEAKARDASLESTIEKQEDIVTETRLLLRELVVSSQIREKQLQEIVDTLKTK